MTNYKECCVVEFVSCNGQNSTGAYGEDMFTICSAVIINQQHGLILTHASVLTSHLTQDNQTIELLQKTGKVSGKYLSTVLCNHVILEECSNNLHVSGADIKTFKTAMLNVDTQAPKTSAYSALRKSDADIIGIFKCRPFEIVLEKLMPKNEGWSFQENVKVPNTKQNDNNNNFDKNEVEDILYNDLLPCFVLLKLREIVCVQSNHLVHRRLRRGETASIVSTPFGSLSPEVFVNSVSRGIICNVAGSSNDFIMTDARCIPGSEGAALYVEQGLNKRLLSGIVTAPMCWKTNEWIGLAVVCSINSVLRTIQRILPSLQLHAEHMIKIPKSIDNKSEEIIGEAKKSIVLVKCGFDWGSGILIDTHQGIVVTCSHVVKGAKKMCQVRFGDLTPSSWSWSWAEVIYRTRPSHVFDIALLRIRKEDIPASICHNRIKVASPYIEGEVTFAVGHALFGGEHNLEPSISKGVVSKVVYLSKIPIMIQSSCAVHAGASGGALMQEDGKILGMITCNTRDVENGASYPHVNLSVPFATIWPVLEKFLETGDYGKLKLLEVQNPEVSRIWSLNRSEPSSKL